MAPYIECETHGVQTYVTTSPRLARVVREGGHVPMSATRILRIDSPEFGRTSERIVDVDFLTSFLLDTSENTVLLKNRDKAASLLNDRLLILRISRQLEWVCPKCLDQAVSKSFT